VIETFEKSESEVKDGMDISLCCLETNKDSKITKLKWAGANNPLWIYEKVSSAIRETRADKQPIGKYTDPKPFTTHELDVNKGDTIYIFTDGYADQFGGEKGKKFKGANLQKLLIEVAEKNPEMQKDLVNKVFENWKANLEQIDDVCIIGVRI
jgi:serine phosphatase RsbU (regulator of sigma subunit)